MTKKKPKQTIFIGNLPFNVQDEKVYHFFSECGDIQYVRMIRDKITNVGKGIGYVMFKDKASVSLALKLDGQLFEKRPIRITRCLKDAKKEEENAVKSYQGEVSNAEKRIKLKRKTLKQPKKKVSEQKKKRIMEKKVRQFKQKEQKRKK
jgi:nucleolar protein 12